MPRMPSSAARKAARFPIRGLCRVGRQGLSEQRQLRHRAQDVDGQPISRTTGPTRAHRQEGQEILRAGEPRQQPQRIGMNKCPDAKIVPLTADSDALLKSIKPSRRAATPPARSPYSGPTTCCRRSGAVLSRPRPRRRPLGPGHRRRSRRYAILMTDGQFNTAFAGVSSNFNEPGHDVAQQRRSDLQEHEGRRHRGLSRSASTSTTRTCRRRSAMRPRAC